MAIAKDLSGNTAANAPVVDAHLDEIDNVAVVSGGGGGSAGAQFNEDAAALDGALGTLLLAVRKDVAGTTVTADGDYSALQLDANGSLRVAVTSGGGGGGTQFGEDAPHASGDSGTVALFVRKDTATQLAGTDGDYSVGITDASGKLWVNTGIVAVTGTFWQATQPVSGTFWQATQPVSIAATVAISAASLPLPTGASTETTLAAVNTKIGNLTQTKAAGTAAANSLLIGGVYNATPPTLTDGQGVALQFDAAGALKTSGGGGGTQYVEDAASAGGETGTVVLTVRKDSLSSNTSANGDFATLLTDANGALYVNGTFTPVQSASTYRLLSAAASTNGANIKTSAAVLFGVDGYNAASYAVYIKFYNKASAPTVGTDTPRKTIMVPALTRFEIDWPMGLAFATGLGIAITKLAADADTTVLVAGDVLVLNVDYT